LPTPGCSIRLPLRCRLLKPVDLRPSGLPSPFGPQTEGRSPLMRGRGEHQPPGPGIDCTIFSDPVGRKIKSGLPPEPGAWSPGDGFARWGLHRGALLRDRQGDGLETLHLKDYPCFKLLLGPLAAGKHSIGIAASSTPAVVTKHPPRKVLEKRIKISRPALSVREHQMAIQKFGDVRSENARPHAAPGGRPLRPSLEIWAIRTAAQPRQGRRGPARWCGKTFSPPTD